MIPVYAQPVISRELGIDGNEQICNCAKLLAGAIEGIDVLK